MLTQDFFNTLGTWNEQAANWYNQVQRAGEVLHEVAESHPGETPSEVIASYDKISVRRFQAPSSAKKANKKQLPLLISYALVNRYTVADLQEGKSLVAKLLAQGIDVYVIDWGYPNPADRYLDMDDYVNSFIDFAVDAVCRHCQVKSINLLGICQGGTLSLCYTALHPEKINKLVTMVTPVDFQTKKDQLSFMVRDIDIEQAVRVMGNISGSVLNRNFNLMQPMSLNVKKWLDAPEALMDAKNAAFFLRMERWINDSPDQAGQMYLEFISNFYQQNKLVRGDMYLDGKHVDLKNITQPVLNVYGLKDHLVPPASSQALSELVGSSNYEELAIDTGHIGMYVSGAAKETPNAIAKWLAG